MRMADLFRDPIRAFLDVEQCVNDGSPSGFSRNSGLSPQYRPSPGAGFFEVPVFALPAEGVTQIGTLAGVNQFRSIAAAHMAAVPVHPDVLSDFRDSRILGKGPTMTLRVAATASERTVMTDWKREGPPIFLKLNCPRQIGRFVRAMPLFKWLGAADSGHFVRAFVRDNPEGFGFFDEFAGVYVEGPGLPSGFGSIFRSFPTEAACGCSAALVPAFGLFSRDQRFPTDPPLLAQFMWNWGWTADDVMHKLVLPLLTNYVHMALCGGLMPECNAQNVVLRVCQDGTGLRWYLRDMEDVWKDLTVRCAIGLDVVCVPYHTIDARSDADYYQRRSFLYDFKLGQYLLEPLARAAALALQVPAAKISQMFQEAGRLAWSGNEDYFSTPDDWYCYPKEASVSRRCYERRERPPFR